MRTALARARALLRADGLALFRVLRGPRLPYLGGAVGLTGRAEAAIAREIPGRVARFVRRVAGARGPIVSRRLAHDLPIQKPRARGGPARLAVGVPVRSGRRLEGSLVALWGADRMPARADLNALRLLGETLGVLLDAGGEPGARSGADPRGQLRSFYRIARLGAVAMPPAELGGLALKELCRALGFLRGEIWLLGPERRKIRCVSTYGLDYALPTQRVDPRDCPFTTMLLRRRQAIHHPDVCRMSPIDKWAPWQEVTAVFGAPLRARGRVIGTLCADRGGEAFEMSARELELGSVLSALVAEVIDSSVERQAEAKRHRLMVLLNRVCRAISREERLPVLLPSLARMIREQTGCHAVQLALVDERHREMKVVAADATGGVDLVGRRFPVSRRHRHLCPGGRAFVLQKPVLVEDTAEGSSGPADAPDVASSMAIPIGSQGSVVGALRLDAGRPYSFDGNDLKVFSILGEQIGHAIRRARVLDTLQRKQADLRAVSRSLETRLEEDRRRIARELHDEVGQSMTAAKINLGLLMGMTKGARPEVRRILRETAAEIDRTIAETRRISMDLRPAMLDELGLLPALRWYASTFARRTGVRVDVAANAAGPRPRREVETLLYRFVQEALTNVARHARARRVRVSLAGANGFLQAVVQDDGIGLSGNGSRAGGLGLLGMRERIERLGGTLRIDSRPGKGTRLMAGLAVGPGAGGRPALASRRGPAARRRGPIGTGSPSRGSEKSVAADWGAARNASGETR